MRNIFIKHREYKIKPVGTITIRSYKAGTKELLQEIVQKNLIMQGTNTGKDLFVQWLISGYTGSNIGLGINYGAIGTGSTTPAVTDTQLQSESARVTPSFAQDSGNTKAILQFFFPDLSLANTTYREFGMFVGGTAVANSGNIFNRALFSSAYTKVSGTDTTVQCDIEFT